MLGRPSTPSAIQPRGLSPETEKVPSAESAAPCLSALGPVDSFHAEGGATAKASTAHTSSLDTLGCVLPRFMSCFYDSRSRALSPPRLVISPATFFFGGHCFNSWKCPHRGVNWSLCQGLELTCRGCGRGPGATSAPGFTHRGFLGMVCQCWVNGDGRVQTAASPATFICFCDGLLMVPQSAGHFPRPGP